MMRWHGLVFAVTVLVAGHLAMSVETKSQEPLYRYALEQYTPSPFEIYCFHQPSLVPTDLQVHLRIANDCIAGSHANLVFAPIVIDGAFDASRLPPSVAARWHSFASFRAEPAVYCLFNAAGQSLFEGSLDETALSTLVNSPARQEISRRLVDGKQLVVVCIPGADGSETFEETVRQAVAEYESRASAEPSMRPARRPTVGLLFVSPIEPAEEWTRRQLRVLAGVPLDSPEPIVAVVFGRGRVVRALAGEGIRVRDLAEDLELVASPYAGSRETVPGFDLLIDYDWATQIEQSSTPPGPATAVAKPSLPKPTAPEDSPSLEPPDHPDTWLVQGLIPSIAACLVLLFWSMFFIIRSR